MTRLFLATVNNTHDDGGSDCDFIVIIKAIDEKEAATIAKESLPARISNKFTLRELEKDATTIIIKHNTSKITSRQL